MFDQTGIVPIQEQTEQLKNLLFHPITVPGGEMVGTLAIPEDPSHPLSPEDRILVQQISDQIALALESARLFSQTQTALAQTEKLSSAGLRFAQAVDLQELVQIATETLGIPQINRAILETFTYNSENKVENMDVVANWWNGSSNEPTKVGMRYTAETLPLMQLFLSPSPIFIKDTFKDERIDSVSMEIVKYRNIRAVAVLPLYLGAQQIGVLLLESETPYNFTQDEVRLFTAMGPQISTVLENRRQFERAQKQAEREARLNIISQKIQGATTVDAVLQIAARELGHALGAPMTIAQLSMKDKK
jgi:GAF domain-containing protein